ncbi:MAG: hypothetical protein AAGH73_07960 [Pseudomonadota bacterium]
MSETSEKFTALEGRLAAALARIQGGLAKIPSAAPEAEPSLPLEAALPAAQPDAGRVAELEAQLEEERSANAQLQQRVKQVRRKFEERVNTLESDLAAARAQVDASEQENAKLQRAGKEMRSALEALQKSSVDEAPDAHLINRAMMTELEALRAERSSEAREISELVSVLEPIVAKGASNA